jgi:muramoyltetrapeptide carboxypeptidase
MSGIVSSPLKPAGLNPGDLITLVSPSSPIPREKLDFLYKLFESEGYRIDVAPNAFATGDYLAGTDDDKVSDLHYAFSNPETKAVFCTRGGYGSARLLKQLDLDAMAASGKMFWGFSDITTLHSALNNRGLVTIHGPMGITLNVPREAYVHESVRAALRGDNPIPLDAPGGTCVVPGVAEGVVGGGCLVLLCDSLGTPEEARFDGKIVVIEDVDEAPHRVDAMLTQLLNHGGIRRAAGLVIGEMTNSDEKIDPGIGGRSWREIVKERLAPLEIPMVIDFPLGHAKQMLSLPFGIRAQLNADTGRLKYLESHVR